MDWTASSTRAKLTPGSSNRMAAQRRSGKGRHNTAALVSREGSRPKENSTTSASKQSNTENSRIQRARRDHRRHSDNVGSSAEVAMRLPSATPSADRQATEHFAGPSTIRSDRNRPAGNTSSVATKSANSARSDRIRGTGSIHRTAIAATTSVNNMTGVVTSAFQTVKTSSP